MKPSLDEFIAALPERPDCGEKLHRFAYCPGRSRIRPEAMQDPTQTENEGNNTMSNAVVTKQGTPSAPGTVVDTSKAAVVPPSSEVKTETAARETAKGKKATQAKVGALATGMVHPARAKDAARKAAAGKGSTKPAAAKKPATKRGTGGGGGPIARLTETWTGKDKKDIVVKDRVKTGEGVVIDVIGRWTKKTAKGNVPMVTGRIVSGAPDGKKVGDRHNAVAAEATHVKK